MNAADNLKLYFEKLWGTNEGIVYLPTRDRQLNWRQLFFEWPLHERNIVAHVLRSAAEQKEVFCAAALFERRVLPIKDGGEGAKPNKYAVKGTQCLWADFDGKDAGTPAPEDWSKHVALVPEPSFTVQTSRPDNQHCYWRLGKFETDLEFVEEINRAIAYSIGSDTGCWDAARLLRPPESINFGYSKPERNRHYPVLFSENSSRHYERADFGNLPPIRLVVQQSVALQDRPSIEDLMLSRLWPKHLIELWKLDESKLQTDRSTYLVKIAMTAAELGWKDGELYSLIEAVDEKVRKYADRQDKVQQLTNIVELARRKHPVGDIDLTFAGLSDPISSEVNPKSVYLYGEFRVMNFPVVWHYNGLLTEDGFIHFFSAPGVGKSQLGTQLSQTSACGEDFLIWKNELGPVRTLFMSLEMGPNSLQYITSKQDGRVGDPVLLNQNFLVMPRGEPIHIDKPEGRTFIEEILAENRPKLVVIDSYSTLTSRSLNDDQPALENWAYLVGLRRKYHCSIAIIHHTNKEEPKPDLTLRDFYGNTFITTGSDAVLGIAYDDPKKAIKEARARRVLRITDVKHRLGPAADSFAVYRRDDLTFELYPPKGVNGHDAILPTFGSGQSVKSLGRLFEQ